MSASDSGGDEAGSAGVESIEGVGPSRGEALRAAGFTSVSDVREASVEKIADAGIPLGVARQINDRAGDVADPGPPGDTETNPPSIAQAKGRAQEIPGAKAKTVRVDGKQQAKVLRQVESKRVGGAHMTVHKG